MNERMRKIRFMSKEQVARAIELEESGLSNKELGRIFYRNGQWVRNSIQRAKTLGFGAWCTHAVRTYNEEVR